MVRTIVVALLIAVAALASKSTKAQTLDSVEIYPGMHQAVAQTIAQTHQPTIKWESVGTVPEKEVLPPDDEVDTRITFYGGGVSDHRRTSTRNESYKQKKWHVRDWPEHREKFVRNTCCCTVDSCL